MRDNWLDVALYVGIDMQSPGNADPGRHRRIMKITKDAGPGDWAAIKMFSDAVQNWVASSPVAGEFIPPDIIKACRKLAPDANLDMAALSVSQYFVREPAQIIGTRTEDSMRIEISGKNPLHEHFAKPFAAFLDEPYPIRRCERCDAPFHGTLRAVYCSPSCRNQASRERMDAAE